MTKIHSRVLSMAHILYNNKPGYKWSDLVAHAWYFEHFIKALDSGIARFSYFKRDGTLREAIGTRYLPIIPADKQPKGIVDRHPVYSAITYFDLEKGEWRAFHITNFTGVGVEYFRLTPSVFTKEKVTKEKTMQRVPLIS